MAFDVPLVAIVFNRPDHTRRMLERLIETRPKRLFVIADGPRNEVEASKAAEVRAVVDSFDWPGELHKIYSDENLGCRRRISSGIDEVFRHVDRAVFVEDDCLPHPTYFPFVSEMLDRYEGDERVMAVSGDNFQFGKVFGVGSYYFSAIPHCWGWATWRRAWEHNDVTMRDWPAAKRTDFPRALLPSGKVCRSTRKLFADVYAGKVDSWAIPWEFSCWRRGGLTVLPNVNLVSNVGFGVGATNCHKVDPFAALPVEAMRFPLVHPGRIEHCVEADLRFYEKALGGL